MMSLYDDDDNEVDIIPNVNDEFTIERESERERQHKKEKKKKEKKKIFKLWFKITCI